MEIEPILDDLARRLHDLDEAPTTEKAIVQLLASSLRSSNELADGDVQFEVTSGSELIDLWIRPHAVAIEVKYHRPLPSGTTRPLTQQFGDILNDIRKLAGSGASRRIVVLVTDDTGLAHLRNKEVLPVRTPTAVVVEQATVEGLAMTAQRRAVPQGYEWTPVSVRLVWSRRLSVGHGLAWEVLSVESNSR